MMNGYSKDLIHFLGSTKSPKTRARMIHIFNRLPKSKRTHILFCYHCGAKFLRTGAARKMTGLMARSCRACRAKGRVFQSDLNIFAPSGVNTVGDPIGELIRSVLHRCAQEEITDEQLERVLAPIKQMIQAGVFDREK